MAQKNKKHEKFGLSWQLPTTWVLAPEKNTATRFYAYPNSGGAGMIDVRDLNANTSGDAATLTIEFMQEMKIEPSFIKDSQPRTIKKGNLQIQIFEKDALDMQLDNGTKLYKNQKLLLINNNKNQKHMLYVVEVYQKPAKHTKAIDNVIKTLKGE